MTYKQGKDISNPSNFKMASANVNNSQNIQVAVRCRPLNDKEKKQLSNQIIECNEKKREVTIAIDRNNTGNTKTYSYDKVFGPNSKQIEVYNNVVKPLVLEVIEGYNCTIFAYGQTGTGKTFTMEGDRIQSVLPDENGPAWEDDQLCGIIPRSVAQLFSALNSMANCEYSVKISYMELYNEELSDLLSESDKVEKLRIYDDINKKGSVTVPELEEVVVKNKNEVYRILQKGSERRQKACTNMNSQSSRSHSIFSVTVFTNVKSIEGEETFKIGKLNLVDLAGSENIERSGAIGKRAAEAGKINKSLTTLGRVITALVEHRDHIPYRESNLTRLLQDSLGGKTKTSIIATVSPAFCNLEETLSTLDYAYKAKSIRNKPEVNQKLVKQTLIKEYTEHIETLKKELHAAREKNGIHLPVDIYNDMVNTGNVQKNELRELLQKVSCLEEEISKQIELYTETKACLDEKSYALDQTKHNLLTTESKLKETIKSYEELQYLLENHSKSESRLYDQANSLFSKNVQYSNDCKEFKSKINRMLNVMSQNRLLTSNFSRDLNENLKQIACNELNMSEFNRKNLTELGVTLIDLNKHLDIAKADNKYQMQIFQNSQERFTEKQQNFVKSDVEDFFIDYIETLDNNQNNFFDSIDSMTNNALKYNQEKSKQYDQTYLQQKNSIDCIHNQHKTFLQRFNESSQSFLSQNSDGLNEMSKETHLNLNKMRESVESFKKENQELKQIKNNFQNYANEAFIGFQHSLKKFFAELNEKFNEVDSRCKRLDDLHEKSLHEINQLKESIDVHDKLYIKNQVDSFNLFVSKPVEELIIADSTEFNTISMNNNTMKNDHDLIMSHHSDLILNIKKNQSENKEARRNEMLKGVQKIEDSCSTFKANLDEFNKETEKFVEEYVSQSIDGDYTDFATYVNKSLAITDETKTKVLDANKFNYESLTNDQKIIQQFSEHDFKTVISTGNTPKSKEFEVQQIKIEKTIPNEELLEKYREELRRSNNDFVNASSIDNNNINLNPPLKRKSGDKENTSTGLLELSAEKSNADSAPAASAHQIKKTKSVARIIPLKKALNEKN